MENLQRLIIPVEQIFNTTLHALWLFNAASSRYYCL